MILLQFIQTQPSHYHLYEITMRDTCVFDKHKRRLMAHRQTIKALQKANTNTTY